MTNYVKNYKNKAITKAYDLLELKANGRIDEDGDYLDGEGMKLTYHIWVDDFGDSTDSTDSYYPERKEELFKYGKCLGIFAGTALLIKDGFICIGVAGEKWCVRRDIFLATYEKVK